MTENTPGPLGNVISIDDERIKKHLDRVVRGTRYQGWQGAAESAEAASADVDHWNICAKLWSGQQKRNATSPPS
jgi:hypothetical protein